MTKRERLHKGRDYVLDFQSKDGRDWPDFIETVITSIVRIIKKREKKGGK